MTQNHAVSRCCWENGIYRLARHWVTANLQSVKKNSVSAKCNEVKCIKRGMPVVPRSSCRDQGPGTPHPRRIREWRLETPWNRRCLGSCQVRKEERDEDMHGGGYANDMTVLEEGPERDSQGEKERQRQRWW